MSEQASPTTPAAFDRLAGRYDDDFTDTALGRLLRRRVWQRLQDHFAPGHRILDLACGTGEDSLWMARQGMRVTALDGSPEMLSVAEEKVRGLAVKTVHGTLESVLNGDWTDEPFDGILSNFGGLNAVAARTRAGLGPSLHALLKPGGRVILVLMGPVCPMEVAGHLLRGNPDAAFRRRKTPALTTAAGVEVPIWYPSARSLRGELSGHFRHLSTESLGLLLPPTDFTGLVQRWPRMFGFLNRVESTMARLTLGWGDHYLSIYERS